MKIITASEMKALEAQAIRNGISSLELMENAGFAAVQFILKKKILQKNTKIFIFCGPGNNGGDGLVMARLFQEQGCFVKVYLLQDPAKMGGDALINLHRFKGEFEVLQSEKSLKTFINRLQNDSIIIDAIFGTGLSRNVEGLVAKVIQVLNAQKHLRISIDIPSGLHADEGRVLGIALEADYTLSFHLPKRGLLFGKDIACVGELSVLPIGIPDFKTPKIKGDLHYNSPALFAAFLKPRKKESYKHQFGHVLTVAGSRKMIGAGLLASRSALRVGAGLSTLALPESAYSKIDPRYAELMFEPLPSEGDFFSEDAVIFLKKLIEGKAAIACGPGMGLSKGCRELVKNLITESNLPLVLDADALNNLPPHIALLKKSKCEIVLTPHLGEMARLTGLSKVRLQADKIAIARSFARKHKVYLVLKGYRSLIATPEGKVFVNATGNPGMATAGTGDVLTGMIAGLLAQAMPMEKAVLAGIWIHGRAGDKVAQQKGEAGMLSWDIAEKVPEVLKEIQGAA